MGLVEKPMVEGEPWYGGEDEKQVMGEATKGGCGHVETGEKKTGEEDRRERCMCVTYKALDIKTIIKRGNQTAKVQILPTQKRDFTVNQLHETVPQILKSIL